VKTWYVVMYLARITA